MTGKNIVVIGASRLGCRYALAARAAGHQVTLIDEHPQPLTGMSLDAPYFYGAGLPASLSDEAAMMDNVIGSNDLLMECAEAEVDLRIATVAWGAFQKVENAQHIETPQVGIVHAEGNEMIPYDQLILATGSRDFVPSFKGWELPGVMGGKAASKLLEAYQVFGATKVIVLGTGPTAMATLRLAQESNVEIAAVIEPTSALQSGPADAAWLREKNINVLYETIILSALGTDGVSGAILASSADGSHAHEIACDGIIVALGEMPNIELPAAMGCALDYYDGLAAWMPRLDDKLQTSAANVHWLSKFSDLAEEDAIARVLAGLSGDGVEALPPTSQARSADYLRHWVERLHATGGSDVILCQCESVTRADFDGLQPPKYLGKTNKTQHSPVSKGDIPRLEQDFVKRITRVGMGHCQGKRCRDEAAMILANRYGLSQAHVRPASYRFPVRPIDLTLFAAPDTDTHSRDFWPHWLQPENH